MNYDVNPDQLRSHAVVLSGYADGLADLGVGLPGALAEQSLGSFAQFLAAGLDGAMTETLTAFGHAASTVDMMADGVRQAADGYDRTDGDNAVTVSAIGGDL
jgi:hypothetical protein